jgi:hypothetical protein
MVTPSSVSPLPLQQDKNRDLETACLAIIFAIWNNGWRAWRGKSSIAWSIGPKNGDDFG